MEQHHQHQETRQVIHRLSRAIGHLDGIKKMVEDGRDCSEILIQLAAVRAAINNTGKIILKDHMEHCVASALENGDHEELDRFSEAVDRFLK